jgi:signal transduction histidine kinase
MAMQANLEAMIDGVMPASTERLVTVNSEVVRLGRLVEGQLKLSRLEARKVEFSPRRLELGTLISRLMDNYQLLVEGSGLELDLSADTNVFIVADPDLIRQAAANLISNAVRYTPDGGRIEVFVQKTNKWAQIVVADTGTGISQEDQKNIFNKFWRAADDRNRDRGGLGIGLAMVREIVHMHSGQITVTSELGVGSRFTLNIPLSA